MGAVAAIPALSLLIGASLGLNLAIDPNTGTLKWEYKMSDLTWAGILTTASNVLFSGGGEGYFYALDARTGNLLWKSQLGSAIRSGPMSFAVNGKQHVTVAAGSALFAFKLREEK